MEIDPKSRAALGEFYRRTKARIDRGMSRERAWALTVMEMGG